MTPTTIQVRQTSGICTITLNRPEVRNAMSLAMINELLTTLRQAEEDSAVRVIVLRGAGGHFCAGGDIGDMAQARMKLAAQQADAGASNAPNPVAAVNAQFGRLCLAFARTPLPVITVLEGTVMGGGFGLACVSDVTLALDTVSFRLPETSLGIIPAQIAPFLVERLGYAEAKRLSVTGAKVGAQEALTIRLVHEVHGDAAALDDALNKVIASILACGPQAIATTKNLLAHARLSTPESLIDDAAAMFARAVLSDEGQEGTSAFMQRRKPAWVPQAV
ncbi:MAG: enoyl-CoA hydratase-related protein [Aquabacterium sp.]